MTMNATGLRAWATLIFASTVAACSLNSELKQPVTETPLAMCRYAVQPDVPGEAVRAAISPQDGYSCADRDGVSAFIATNAEECPELPLRTTIVSKIGLSEGSAILRSCNALASPETARSGEVLLARVRSASAVDDLEEAALRGGYFVTYYLRENELHCFEVADGEKARAAGLARLAERFAVPDGLTWTKGTCRQAVRNTYGRNFSWRDGM